jgi:hypothetical protein
VPDVGLLARSPRRLRIFEGVGTSAHDLSSDVPESRTDVLEPRPSTAVLGRVVEEGADDDVLVARSVLDHERGDGEEMGQIRDLRTLSDLIGMDRARVGHGSIEALR